ncbi:HET domain protein [Penicillium sp. IBT 35674x]|nr:HET domain protein [Penicillium sp. IBT 35674x]
MAVIQDRDKLCSPCSRIPPIKDIIFGSEEMWGSFQEFKSSALNGCPLCSYLYNEKRKEWDSLEVEKNLYPGEPISLQWNGPLPLRPTPVNEEQDLIIECTWGTQYSVVYSIFVDAEDLSYADEPISKTVPLRKIDPDPMSDQVVDKINGWIASCSHSHSSCHPAEDALLPRFVIEIQGSEDTKPSLRLFENGQKMARYIALSYVWGIRPQPVQLMRENMEQLKESIDYDTLPSTIQDAICVARCLGVQYVWVDALCIVQDDDDIKKQQIGQMQNIYGNSYLTVQAANVATVKESFLKLRNSPKPFKLRYDDSSHIYLRGYTPDRMPGGSARQRAWVFQESILPNRLLVYGEHQLVFQCREGIQYEYGFRANQMKYRSPATPSFLRPGNWLNYLGKRLIQPIPPPDRRLDYLSAWYSALDDGYTTRLLTFPSDRLPAISGIALRFQKEIGGRYVAGLWESDLPWGLLWESKNTAMYPSTIKPAVWWMSRPANPCAPSWSWAAMDGSTRHAFWARHNDTREHGSPIATACMKSLQVNMAGEIVNSDGMLQIGAPLIYAAVICKTDPRHMDLRQYRLMPNGKPRGGSDPFLVWETPDKGSCGSGESDSLVDRNSRNGERPIAIALFDVEDEQNSYSDVWCLLICRSSALMLECVDKEKSIYRRLGIARVRPEFWPFSLTEQLWTEISLI